MLDFVTGVTANGFMVSQPQARQGAGCDGVTAVTAVSRTYAHTHTRAHTCVCNYRCHICHSCHSSIESGV